MTRLINADALMEKSFEIEYADGWHKSVTKEVVSVKDINNAPTIESSGDTISRAEVLALINKAMYNTDNKEIQDYLFCGLRRDVHNLPTIEPSGNLVSRQDAIKVGNKIIEELSLSSIDWDDLKYWAKELFDALPSADRPKGEWIDKGEYAECSICRAHSGKQFDGVEPIPLKTKFCPNCGADMRGDVM